jgi:hypothetical protein
MRTPAGLIVPGSGNGNPSASERRIAILTVERDLQKQRADHVTAMLAVVIVQAGGEVTIPVADLKLVYDINAKATPDELALVWTASLQPIEPPKPLTLVTT